MKSILGIGNALTDILAVLPDDTLLKKYHLPKGSMQHVDMETGDRIWEALKEYGVKAQMLYSRKSSGRCMVFITGANAERTFAQPAKGNLFKGPFHIPRMMLKTAELYTEILGD